jgi:hypothetical protein
MEYFRGIFLSGTSVGRSIRRLHRGRRKALKKGLTGVGVRCLAVFWGVLGIEGLTFPFIGCDTCGTILLCKIVHCALLRPPCPTHSIEKPVLAPLACWAACLFKKRLL